MFYILQHCIIQYIVWNRSMCNVIERRDPLNRNFSVSYDNIWSGSQAIIWNKSFVWESMYHCLQNIRASLICGGELYPPVFVYEKLIFSFLSVRHQLFNVSLSLLSISWLFTFGNNLSFFLDSYQAHMFWRD